MPPDNQQSAIILIVVAAVTFPTCCCTCYVPIISILGIIFGVLALLEAGNVKKRYEAGDYEGAEAASKQGQKWIKTGVISMGAAVLAVLALNLLLYGFSFLTHSMDMFKNRGG
jgi:hypothetical protein